MISSVHKHSPKQTIEISSQPAWAVIVKSLHPTSVLGSNLSLWNVSQRGKARVPSLLQIYMCIYIRIFVCVYIYILLMSIYIICMLLSWFSMNYVHCITMSAHVDYVCASFPEDLFFNQGARRWGGSQQLAEPSIKSQQQTWRNVRKNPSEDTVYQEWKGP